MYTSTMEESTHSVKSRPYVDDITLDYTGPDPVVSVEVVSDMVRFTNKFAEDLGFIPNLVKSKALLYRFWHSCRFERVAGTSGRVVFLGLGSSAESWQ